MQASRIKQPCCNLYAETMLDVHVQVWRPLAGPVDDSPLVLADASSVAEGDLMPVALHRPTYSGQTYAVAHNPAHK